MFYRSNFIFANMFSSDQNDNRSTFKSIYNTIENTGNHISLVVNKLNKLGNDIIQIRKDFYKTLDTATNTNFFHNTVMISVNNEKDITDLVSKDNIYYLLLCGSPKQNYKGSDHTYINIGPQELLNQIDMYTQAHKNNIAMGLDEVLRYTTGTFAFVLYIAPTNDAYFFTSNKTVYIHQDDDSIYIFSDKPNNTDLEVSTSTNIENRTIYSFNSTGKYIFKQYYVDDPKLVNNKYNLTCNYDGSIESFVLPYIVNDLFTPNNIQINAMCILDQDELTNTDKLTILKDSFSKFEVSYTPLSKGELLFNYAVNNPINYIDYTNDLIEIEKTEKVASLTGSRYIPVFKNLQDHEILQLAIYLNVPFNRFKSKCKHSSRDKMGNYILCGECDECKDLYTKFAQLGYTYDNMPVKFKNYTELDNIKINNVINESKLTEQDYLTLRNKIVEVFPYDLH